MLRVLIQQRECTSLSNCTLNKSRIGVHFFLIQNYLTSLNVMLTYIVKTVGVVIQLPAASQSWALALHLNIIHLPIA